MITIAEFTALVLYRLEWAILVYFLLVNGFYAILLFSAMVEMRYHLLAWRGEYRGRVLSSPVAPSISILAPAYNEAATIVESLRSLLALHYPNLEVVVVNDGSSDETMEVLRTHFDLVSVHPIFHRRIRHESVKAIYYSRSNHRLVVVDKENGGKADALNTALNIATGRLVCAIDADTLVEADALQRMVRPFLQGSDVLAVGGTIRIANESVVRSGRVIQARAPRNPVTGYQAVEYLRAFLFGRLGWNRMGGNLIISGAFGLFRRDAVQAVGGYLHETVGEDMELVIRLRRYAYEQGLGAHVSFIPDPVAWTEAPETLRVLGRQRDRWQRGLADTLWRHRDLLLNPRYGAMGMVAMPYFVFVELLAPVVEMMGIIGLLAGLALGMINYSFALLFFLVAYGLGAALTLLTLAMEEVSFHRYDRFRDRAILVFWVLTENLGYRQLTILWRIHGLVRFLRGRTDWGAMERRGFQGDPDPPAAAGVSESRAPSPGT